MKTLFNYFIRGLIFFFPVFATFYVIFVTVNWANATFNELFFDWLQHDIPGLGIITVIILISLLGFIVKFCVSKPILNFFESLLTRTPLVKIIYSSVKDLTEAFVGDKKKFNQPVIISLSNGLERFGFLTEENLSNLDIEDRVAVYCPHSYNFSGNLYLVKKESIKLLHQNPSDVMKFIVSAGVTHIGDIKAIEL
ncbi:MAG: DUF502 domain-containing protein [Balneolaceae bacterium]